MNKVTVIWQQKNIGPSCVGNLIDLKESIGNLEWNLKRVGEKSFRSSVSCVPVQFTFKLMNDIREIIQSTG